jgi:hypothetical protein
MFNVGGNGAAGQPRLWPRMFEFCRYFTNPLMSMRVARASF